MTSDLLPDDAPSGAPRGGAPRDPDQVVVERDAVAPPAIDDAIADYLAQAEAAPTRQRRLPVLTLVLVAGVVAAVAFTAGLVVQDRRVEGEAAAGLPAGFPGGGLPGGGFPAGGQLPEGFELPEGMAPPGAATGGATDAPTATSAESTASQDPTVAGDVVLVDAGNLYVEVGAAAPVKVVTSETTSVVDASGGSVTTLEAVETGARVIVDGTRTADNDLDATTIVVTG